MTVFLNIKKHGKGAGNTGLTQATLGGTPIVDEKKACNTKVMNFCQKNNLPFDPEFCWDNNKYDPNQTPSCQLDGNDEYICNTEASDYCFDVSISLSLSLSLPLHFDSNAFISLFFVSSFSIYKSYLISTTDLVSVAGTKKL